MCMRASESEQEMAMEILDSDLDGKLIWHVRLFIRTCSLRAISSLRVLCLHVGGGTL